MKISAVVVTFNRVNLLCECLDALLNQSVELDEIVLVDNCSTDTTHEVVSNRYAGTKVKYHLLRENYGGAGGFFFGIKQAYANGADWIWAMDDDTIATPTALAELLAARELLSDANVSFLASKVLGENGEPMNVPSISKRPHANGYPFWYKHLEQGMVEIADATLVSLLFNRKAVEACGLPYKEFFIWGDDYEYTTRLTRSFGPAFFVGKSIAIHKRNGAKALNFKTEENERTIRMSKYFYRNMLINLQTYGDFSSVAKFLLRMVSDAFNILFHQKKKYMKIAAIIKGFGGYVFGSYGRTAYKNRHKNLATDTSSMTV